PAAWLHDIGYAPEIATLRFHPLDGARYLVDRGWAPEICSLVAWHTSAREEARLRQLDHRLTEEFDEPDWLALAALSWADLTSSPTGEATSAPERIAEILTRYEPGSVVHRAITTSRPALLEMASVIEIALDMMDAAGERAAS
ncbi:MAG: phosphohydrolase, partial [Acidimicrobiales bacterium]